LISARGTALSELGYAEEHLIEPAQYPYGVVYALSYASQVMGIGLPPLLQNTNDPGAVSLLHSNPPSLVCGSAAFSDDLPAQMATFYAARQLAYMRPGFYARQLLGSPAALKAWLFAAIKLITPKFPIAQDIEGAVVNAFRALETNISPQMRDQLTHIVGKLLSEGAALDIKRWVGALDQTADRAGFVLCDDLQTAIDVVRAGAEPNLLLDMTARVKNLLLYSVSEDYFRVRGRLRIGLA
jgi:hypothetical protein